MSYFKICNIIFLVIFLLLFSSFIFIVNGENYLINLFPLKLLGILVCLFVFNGLVFGQVLQMFRICMKRNSYSSVIEYNIS